MFRYYGNATRHLILGAFIVFSGYVIAHFFCGLTSEFWWLPMANTAIILLIECFQALKLKNVEAKHIIHSIWDFVMGTTGGWVTYLLLSLIK